jgi:hypothetical protein
VRSIVAVLIIFSLGSAYALETGGRYDFFCDHGQDIMNAELVGEDDTRYYVKLSVSVSRLAIEKKNVLHTSRKASSPVAAQAGKPHPFSVTLLGGLGFASGRLAEFSPVTPAITLYGAYRLKERWDLAVRGDFMRFANGDAALRPLFFSAGMGFNLPWQFSQIRFFSGVSVGVAWLYAVAEGLKENSLTPAVILWSAAERSFTERISVTIFTDLSYIYDKQTFVLIPAVRLGVSYRL